MQPVGLARTGKTGGNGARIHQLYRVNTLEFHALQPIVSRILRKPFSLRHPPLLIAIAPDQRY